MAARVIAGLGSLFDRYRRLDEHMTRIELQLEELAIGWDRQIQEEVDASRGK
ncbi:MAG TPA: hypothetical protein VI035_03120 [Solirubrobacterales bacterium]